MISKNINTIQESQNNLFSQFNHIFGESHLIYTSPTFKKEKGNIPPLKLNNNIPPLKLNNNIPALKLENKSHAMREIIHSNVNKNNTSDEVVDLCNELIVEMLEFKKFIPQKEYEVELNIILKQDKNKPEILEDLIALLKKFNKIYNSLDFTNSIKKLEEKIKGLQAEKKDYEEQNKQLEIKINNLNDKVMKLEIENKDTSMKLQEFNLKLNRILNNTQKPNAVEENLSSFLPTDDLSKKNAVNNIYSMNNFSQIEEDILSLKNKNIELYKEVFKIQIEERKNFENFENKLENNSKILKENFQELLDKINKELSNQKKQIELIIKQNLDILNLPMANQYIDFKNEFNLIKKQLLSNVEINQLINRIIIMEKKISKLNLILKQIEEISLDTNYMKDIIIKYVKIISDHESRLNFLSEYLKKIDDITKDFLEIKKIMNSITYSTNNV
jgi:hypothetical protein